MTAGIDEAPRVTNGQWVRDLLARRSDIELKFVQHRDTGTVHVVVPVDPEAVPEDSRPVTDEDKAMVILSLMRTIAPTVCGYKAVVYMDPTLHTDNFVSVFEDDLTCQRCCKVLGEHSNRAFEHPVPRPSTEDES